MIAIKIVATRLIIRTIQLSACAFLVAMVRTQYDNSELVPSSSSSVEGVGNISPIKTSRNNDWFDLIDLSIILLCWAKIAIEWNMAFPSYFIVHSPRTRNDPMYTKLEWFIHRILSFRVQAYAMTWRIRDYRQVWGSLRLVPINRRLLLLFV